MLTYETSKNLLKNVIKLDIGGKPLLAVVDEPNNMDIITDELYFQGWALYTSDGITNGIGEITVDINSIPGEVNYKERTDVKNAVPGYPDYSTSGFFGTIDTRRLAPGTYSVTVTILGKSDNLLAEMVRTVIKPEPIRFIQILDMPQDNTIIDNVVEVSGWALYSQDTITDGIADITIQISRLSGRVTRRLRQDVQNAVPGYPDYSGSGYSAVIDTSSFDPGEYELQVTFYNKSNDIIHVARRRLAKTAAATKQFLFFLDAPSDFTTTKQYIDIRGWTLYNSDDINISGTGDVDIEIFLGSKKVYTVKASRYERSDVKSAIPGFSDADYANCGFSHRFDMSTFPYGLYNLSINIWNNQMNTILLTYIRRIIKSNNIPSEYTLTAEPGQVYDIILQQDNAYTFQNIHFKITYNPSILGLEDIAVYEPQNAGIVIISSTPGNIQFKVQREVPENSSLSGILTIARFKSISGISETTNIIFEAGE